MQSPRWSSLILSPFNRWPSICGTSSVRRTPLEYIDVHGDYCTSVLDSLYRPPLQPYHYAMPNAEIVLMIWACVFSQSLFVFCSAWEYTLTSFMYESGGMVFHTVDCRSSRCGRLVKVSCYTIAQYYQQRRNLLIQTYCLSSSFHQKCCCSIRSWSCSAINWLPPTPFIGEHCCPMSKFELTVHTKVR